MWYFILFICVIAIIIYNTSAHKKNLAKIGQTKGTPELTPNAKQLMSDFHKDFTKGQRYAYYNLLSTISECHTNSSQNIKNKVNFTLRQTAQFLNISPDQADAYLHLNGVKELCQQLKSIPKGPQLDSIISTAFGMASAAEGYIEGIKANEYAVTLLIKIFGEAGISEVELVNSMDKSSLLMSGFL